ARVVQVDPVTAPGPRRPVAHPPHKLPQLSIGRPRVRRSLEREDLVQRPMGLNQPHHPNLIARSTPVFDDGGSLATLSRGQRSTITCATPGETAPGSPRSPTRDP